MDSQGLPPGWSMGYDSITGFPFFINHIDKSTTWEDPRKSKVNNSTQNLHSAPTYSSELTNNHRQQHSLANERLTDLSNSGDSITGSIRNNNQPKKQSYYDNVSEPISIKIHSINSFNNDNNKHREYEHQSCTPETQSSDSYKFNENSFTNEVESVPTELVSIKNPDNNNIGESLCKPATLDPLAIIDQAQCELNEIKAEINEFLPLCKNKAYLLLEDKLDKLMLRCDNIESAGDLTIKNKRREVILAIQTVLINLENKLPQFKSVDDQDNKNNDLQSFNTDELDKKDHSSVDSSEINSSFNREEDQAK
ncbi:hypothetical protein MN116_008616 [Schistosoma mekongi]|uniref:BAG family molecular chaperone regulator 3 n=1 Tax=Schistosoma mekongi TaxID=38744 RepID=A0AAE2D194_SCHME|nr:hypothetical protein MN116_008616 [Schistosoma mekongi]